MSKVRKMRAIHNSISVVLLICKAVVTMSKVKKTNELRNLFNDYSLQGR